ncbi:MAG: hypothetical protein AB1646_21465 [Thermodesulfobacteriota bacterium]
MVRCRGVLIAAVAGLALVCAHRTAYGEFTLGGSFSYNYTSYSQGGSRGFFGAYNVDRSASGDFAPLNAWTGVNTIVSGTNAGSTSDLLTATAIAKINEAVKCGAVFKIGPYFTGEAPGAGTVIAPVSCTRVGAFVNTPWGTVSYGKLRFGFGSGLQFHVWNRTEECLLVRADRWRLSSSLTNKDRLKEATGLDSEEYVALSAAEQTGLADAAGQSVLTLDRWAREPGDNELRTTNRLTIGFGVYPWRRGSTAYWADDDLNSSRTADLLGFVCYETPRLELEFVGLYSGWHEGPEAQKTTASRFSAVPTEVTVAEGTLSGKLSDGRFFLNAEAAWYYRTDRYQSSVDGTFNGTPAITPGGGGSRFAPQYVQSWRYMAETGVVQGPVKLSALYVHMPGPDRRHGTLIDRQPYVQQRQQSARHVFGQYSQILAGGYGGGVNAPADLSDANTFALRIDYALAANLNIYATALHARRVSHGYGWGYIRPRVSSHPLFFGTVEYAQTGDFNNPAPAIPDNNLGWEVDVGASWGLLEGWELSVGAGYWQPGRWFNFACVDKGVPNWENPTGANNFGVNPNRRIDPIFGVDVSLGIAF